MFLMIVSVSCLLPYAISVTREDPLPPPLPYPESHYVDIDGVRVHYRLYESEPISGNLLLIHGLGGSTYSFEHVAGPLSDAGYLTVAVDLPGFGYSGRPEKFDHSQLNRARLLWSLLDRLDKSLEAREWIILGHSMGGGTAIAMASLRPGQTRKLILVAPALKDRGGLAARSLSFPPFARWLQIFLERSLISEKRFRSILANAYGREPTDAQVFAYLDPLLGGGTARTLDSMTRTSRSVELSSLSDLRMPVFAIWGAEDRIVDLEEARALGAALAQMRLYIIEESGHLPMESHPETFNRILFEILGLPR